MIIDTTGPLIIGDGKFPEAAAYRDVQNALADWPEIVLCPQMASTLGEEIPEGSVIYNLEQLNEGNPIFEMRGYMEVLRKYRVVDYQRKNVEYLRSVGIEAIHMPYGWHAGLKRAPVVEKDIDVLFVGSLTARREQVLGDLVRSGVTVCSAQGAYGAELDALIARARVHLNVHRVDEHPLEVVRLNYLMANGCFIVSERGWDEEDNARYDEGLVFVEYEDLATMCRVALREHDTRRTIAARGECIITNMPQSVFTERAKREV